MLTCIYLCRTLLFFAPYADFFYEKRRLSLDKGGGGVLYLYSDGPDRALFRTETANAPVGGTENETPLAYSIFYRIIY